MILHRSKKQLDIWKEQIDDFLHRNLKLELHKQKSRVIPLARGIDFVGFRNFNHYKILRKRNIRSMKIKIKLFEEGLLDFRSLSEVYQGWQAYAKWANTCKSRQKIKEEIIDAIWRKV